MQCSYTQCVHESLQSTSCLYPSIKSNCCAGQRARCKPLASLSYALTTACIIVTPCYNGWPALNAASAAAWPPTFHAVLMLAPGAGATNSDGSLDCCKELPAEVPSAEAPRAVNACCFGFECFGAKCIPSAAPIAIRAAHASNSITNPLRRHLSYTARRFGTERTSLAACKASHLARRFAAVALSSE